MEQFVCHVYAAFATYGVEDKSISICLRLPVLWLWAAKLYLDIFYSKNVGCSTFCIFQYKVIFVPLQLAVFTALHGMQMRSSDENSLCPSVCLYDRQRRELWQNVRKISPDFYTIEKEGLVGATLSTWNFGLTSSRWSKIADFEPIITRSASAITPSEKFQLTLMRSPLRAFHHRTLPLIPLKNAKRPFFV